MRILHVVIIVLLSVSALALTVRVAPPGTLPDEAVRLADASIVTPATIDSLSFYDDADGVRMVSQLYPLATDGCEWKEGQRSLPARIGTYCFGTDTATYIFRIDGVGHTSVDINITQVVQSDDSSSDTTSDTSGSSSPVPRPASFSEETQGMPFMSVFLTPVSGAALLGLGFSTSIGIAVYLLWRRP